MIWRLVDCGLIDDFGDLVDCGLIVDLVRAS